MAAAEAGAPYRPARFIDRCRLGRRLEYLGVGERDVLRQIFALVRDGLAVAIPERVVAGSTKLEVARVKITQAGRKALAGTKQ
jgi:hypothetical protein